MNSGGSPSTAVATATASSPATAFSTVARSAGRSRVVAGVIEVDQHAPPGRVVAAARLIALGPGGHEAGERPLADPPQLGQLIGIRTADDHVPIVGKAIAERVRVNRHRCATDGGGGRSIRTVYARTRSAIRAPTRCRLP